MHGLPSWTCVTLLLHSLCILTYWRLHDTLLFMQFKIWLAYSKLYIFEIYSMLSFNINIHPWNHQDQDNKYNHHLPIFSCSPLMYPLSVPFLQPQRITDRLFVRNISLHFLEFYINKNIQFVLWVVWLLSFTIIILTFICATVCINSSFILIAE